MNSFSRDIELLEPTTLRYLLYQNPELIIHHLLANGLIVKFRVNEG